MQAMTEIQQVLGRLTAGRRHPEMLDRIEAFIYQGQATGAVLDAEDDRWTAQGVLDYWLATFPLLDELPMPPWPTSIPTWRPSCPTSYARTSASILCVRLRKPHSLGASAGSQAGEIPVHSTPRKPSSKKRCASSKQAVFR